MLDSFAGILRSCDLGGNVNFPSRVHGHSLPLMIRLKRVSLTWPFPIHTSTPDSPLMLWSCCVDFDRFLIMSLLSPSFATFRKFLKTRLFDLPLHTSPPPPEKTSACLMAHWRHGLFHGFCCQTLIWLLRNWAWPSWGILALYKFDDWLIDMMGLDLLIPLCAAPRVTLPPNQSIN